VKGLNDYLDLNDMKASSKTMPYPCFLKRLLVEFVWLKLFLVGMDD
tara:strand:+ start:291 stop:428 length:138 start_codon:yes stop_codon:yes gene_type:complete